MNKEPPRICPSEGLRAAIYPGRGWGLPDDPPVKRFKPEALWRVARAHAEPLAFPADIRLEGVPEAGAEAGLRGLIAAQIAVVAAELGAEAVPAMEATEAGIWREAIRLRAIEPSRAGRRGSVAGVRALVALWVRQIGHEGATRALARSWRLRRGADRAERRPEGMFLQGAWLRWVPEAEAAWGLAEGWEREEGLALAERVDGAAALELRSQLRGATEAGYAAARAAAEEAWEAGSSAARLGLALCFPAEVGWAREAEAGLFSGSAGWGAEMRARAEALRAILPHISREFWLAGIDPGLLGDPESAARAVEKARENPNIAWARVLCHLEGSEIGPLLVAALESPHLRAGEVGIAEAEGWLLARPKEALLALARASAQRCVELRRRILTEHPDLAGGGLIAPEAEWPRALQRAAGGALPPNWQGAGYGELRLRDGRGLPAAALDRLGRLLSEAAMHPSALASVGQALDPQSRRDFCTRLVLYHGPLGKVGDFVYLAALLFGGDELLPWYDETLQDWWSHGGGARATKMVQALGRCGTLGALRRLQRLALKAKAEKVRGMAAAELEEAARGQGLSRDQLADRLVPELGIGPDGRRRLDYGGRAFFASFDDDLQPRLSDAEGRPLADLPKPGGRGGGLLGPQDDLRLAGLAQEDWRRLKKEGRAVLIEQRDRLEQAMIDQRAWGAREFREILCGSPALRIVARRLLWQRGGARFRLDEAGQPTTVEDAPMDWAPGDTPRVTLPHPLEIPDAERAAWGQVFADYAILQPFPQLGREVFGLWDRDRIAQSCVGREVTDGWIRGLLSRGWRRGGVEDAGLFYSVSWGHGGVTATLEHTGVPVTFVDWPGKALPTLRSLTISGGGADLASKITLSEVLRMLQPG